MASKFFPKGVSLPRRAIAPDELSGARESMAFSRVVANTDRLVQVERANRYGMGRFQRVVYG
ncbi:hypothetical protein [Bradyrhizobium sp. 6(2017)]|uniref:hypothetical protein n=1 Tax=Bradyrhizobium sp. 6(2017) TaxID=1197460 RepID=UPI0013E1C016|nr:hypothetical protein [Bradyrhizobium sp. 6(2017)]QIG97911.1 hypothetical protein G6P99_40500 [Bradyrhizobium sp. 6(2017)]